MTRYLGIALLLALWLSAAVADPAPIRDLVGSATCGDGQIYAGGDPRLERLTLVRERLNVTLRTLQESGMRETLCTAACGPSADRTLCHALQALTEPQRDECRKFLGAHARAIAALETPFSVSAVPLHATAAGKRAAPAVGAVTRQGASGGIVFHEGTVGALSDTRLVALLFHELGHKTVLSGGGFVSDEAPIGAFPHGRLLLDAAGAAVALLSERAADPAQEPRGVGDADLRESACALASDVERGTLVGMWADLTGTLPAAEELSAWRDALARRSAREGTDAAWRSTASVLVASRPAKRAAIAWAFRAYLGRDPLPAETELMISRMAQGDSLEAIVASILGDREYVAAHGAADGPYLAAAFAALTGRAPDAAETARWLRKIARYDKASWALLMLRHSDDVMRHSTARWYRELLNRLPAPDEASRHAGELAAGSGWDPLRIELLASPEYAGLQRKRWRGCAARAVATAKRERSSR